MAFNVFPTSTIKSKNYFVHSWSLTNIFLHCLLENAAKKRMELEGYKHEKYEKMKKDRIKEIQMYQLQQIARKRAKQNKL